MPIKLNVVLGPENKDTFELTRTINWAAKCGVRKINLREPYGQPHVGNPFQYIVEDDIRYGMPVYRYWDSEVTYWNVHTVEVESVNLYANGVVSTDYPVTRGHDPLGGAVHDQSHWATPGRHVEQWVKFPMTN
jgi:hypothetical protein